MDAVSARRELAIVVALAVSGIALVFVVAFAPWYSPTGLDDARPGIVHTYSPQAPPAALGR